MIADRHIFIVGEQRLVGPEQPADVGRVVDADIEIGVIADQRGDVHPDFALADQPRLDVVAVALVAQQLRQTQPQVAMLPRARATARR